MDFRAQKRCGEPTKSGCDGWCGWVSADLAEQNVETTVVDICISVRTPFCNSLWCGVVSWMALYRLPFLLPPSSSSSLSGVRPLRSFGCTLKRTGPTHTHPSSKPRLLHSAPLEADGVPSVCHPPPRRHTEHGREGERERGKEREQSDGRTSALRHTPPN